VFLFTQVLLTAGAVHAQPRTAAAPAVAVPAVAAVPAATPAAATATQPNVAIMDFEFGTVKTTAAAFFDSNADIGRGIRNLVTEKLVNGRRYSVIDRSILDKVMAEQVRASSSRFDTATAIELGKLIGVEAIIIGSITRFGRDDSNTNLSGGGGGNQRTGWGKYLPGGGGGADVKLATATATVSITAQLVSTATGKILAVAHGNGASKRRSTKVGGAGHGLANGGFGEVAFGSNNFGETIIGEATLQAVSELATALEAQVSSVPMTSRVIEGVVADISDGVVTLTVGTKHGVAKGMTFAINGAGREVRHPETGKVIRRIEAQLGLLTVTEVGDDWCAGRFTGDKPPARGATARYESQ
jgi:curli biogenesis system outer membrane secretion channel CsgG